MTRFARFNIVGVLGFGVQVAVLLWLERLGCSVFIATIVAVEAALLHNFVWHEWWTWADVRAGSRPARLARFHAMNGLISLGGNALITTALVAFAVPVVLANICAVGVCAAGNFVAAHLFVFCVKTWPTFNGHLQ